MEETWDALVAEMTKKPKMVITSIQSQLCNMKCSRDNDLREYLDNAQDLYARLNDMGATVIQSEFFDIILTPLPPPYESVMSALTTSVEEIGKPMGADRSIRVLKSQYNRCKSLSIHKEEQIFVGTSANKVHISTNCKKSSHSIETCWDRGGGKEGKDLRQKKRNQLKKKKGRLKACTAEEASDKEDDESLIAFINFNYMALIMDTSEAVVIIDTCASSHMMHHQKLLRNYRSFAQPRNI